MKGSREGDGELVDDLWVLAVEKKPAVMRTRVHDYVLEKRVNVVMEIRDGRVMMVMTNLDIASGGCIFEVVYNLNLT